MKRIELIVEPGRAEAIETELQRALDSLQLHEREERMRLAVENERTWFCGDPSPEQARLWPALRLVAEGRVRLEGERVVFHDCPTTDEVLFRPPVTLRS